MDISETRKRRLLELTERYESVADFCRKCNLTETYIRQLTGGHRNIGEKTARKIERAAGIESAWLDGEVGYGRTDEGSAQLRSTQVEEPSAKYIDLAKKIESLSPNRRKYIVGEIAEQLAKQRDSPTEEEDRAAKDG